MHYYLCASLSAHADEKSLKLVRYTASAYHAGNEPLLICCFPLPRASDINSNNEPKIKMERKALAALEHVPNKDRIRKRRPAECSEQKKKNLNIYEKCNGKWIDPNVAPRHN